MKVENQYVIWNKFVLSYRRYCQMVIYFSRCVNWYSPGLISESNDQNTGLGIFVYKCMCLLNKAVAQFRMLQVSLVTALMSALKH